MAQTTVVAHGDSITYGAGLSDRITQAWPPILQFDMNGRGYNTSVHNLGNGGSGFGTAGDGTIDTNTLVQDGTTLVDPLLAPNAVLIVWAGTNDLSSRGNLSAAQAYADFQTYISARLNAGWIAGSIIVCTVIARGDQDIATKISTFNNSLVSGASTYGYQVVRLDQDLRMQDPTNATYYQGDQLHLTTGGESVIESLIEPAIAPILPRRGWIAS